MKIIDRIVNVENRLNAKTPGHFKDMRRLGILMAGLGFITNIAALLVPILAPIAIYSTELFWAGLTMAVTSQTAKE